MIKNAEDELKLTIRRTPKVVLPKENKEPAKVPDKLSGELPVVIVPEEVPEEYHECDGYNRRKESFINPSWGAKWRIWGHFLGLIYRVMQNRF